jgi:hypothetical protein
MTQEKMTPLRERMIEDMRIQGMGDKAQKALKWSGKFGQRAKVYPTLMNGYENDEATEFFR